MTGVKCYCASLVYMNIILHSDNYNIKALYFVNVFIILTISILCIHNYKLSYCNVYTLGGYCKHESLSSTQSSGESRI